MDKKVISVLILLLAVLLLISCSNITPGKQQDTPQESQTTDTPETEPVPDTETEPPAPPETEPEPVETEPLIPDEIIPVSIYDCIYEGYDGEKYGRVSVLQDDLTRDIDLCVIGVFLSNDEVVEGTTFQNIWRSCISKLTADVSAYRIGFVIDYATKDGKTVKMTIMRPEDIKQDENWEYVEMYAYDDIANEYAAWYYHLLPESFDDNSLMTSFKVTAGNRISEVTEIHLKVFLYRHEDMEKIYEDDSYTDRLNRHTVTIIPSIYR